jgi:CelD/BcsL family acetyltransferase involved in cellulose biosynthesis
MPLRRTPGALRSLTNTHTAEFGPVCEPDQLVAVLRALFGLRFGRLELEYVSPTALSREACADAAAATGVRLIVQPQERSPYVQLPHGPAAFDAGLSSRLLADLRRRRRRLEELGEVGIDVHDGSDDLPTRLAEGFSVEGSGWKTERGTAIVSNPETLGFYTSVARWAADHGWLRLWFLRLDGKAVAFELDIEHDGTCYRVKGGYDPEFRRYGAGKQLLHAVLADAAERGLRRFEFLGHDEPYKFEWTDLATEYPLVRAFRPTVAGRLQWSAYAQLRPLVRRAGLSVW